MISMVVMSEVDAVMYIILGRAENHVTYREIVGTTKCITL
jgi:hypothetical protein